MTDLSCPNRKDFFARMTFVVLLCLALHCVVAYGRGARGRELFGIGDFSQARTLLIGLGVVAVVAYASFPRQGKGTTAPVEPAKPVEPVKPAESAEPVKPVVSAAPAEPVKSSSTADVSPSVSPSARMRPARGASAFSAAGEAVEPSAASPEVNEMVDRMWRAARKIAHNFVPDPKADSRYLSLVHGAAMSGHPEAQSKLGEYAMRRGRPVEAYYWMKLAQLNGMHGLEQRMRDCFTQWKRRGCPPEHKNVYEFFTERQGALGRALIRLDSGINVDQALARLRDMANEGEIVAVLMLRQRGIGLK